MTRAGKIVALITVGTVVSVLAAEVRACFIRAPLPVQVWADHIRVDIVDNVAIKTYDCVFKNPNSQAVVGGECFMELEPGTFVDKMSVTVDGKEMQAEILDVKKANEVFQDIVRRGGSPALLEYYGNQLIRTQVPRIAPNGTVRVRLTYTTTLKPQGGLVRLRMLNTNPKTLMQKLDSASIEVNIRSRQPIQNIFSPTHPVQIVEKPDWDVCLQWSQRDYLPKHPFLMYYQLSPSDVGASLIAHRDPDDEGSFMLMLSPSVPTPERREPLAPLPKDVVFCVDTSGSMIEGNKMQQAREALIYCLKHLRSGDRFNIVDFSTEARAFRDRELVAFSPESQRAALEYANNLHARGGTAIEEALAKSIELLKGSDHLKMIVFTTDGLPTIGEREPQKLLQRVTELNGQGIRLFCFGEGIDVNTRLLDALALENRGETDYILPEENISERISRFFDRVGTPVMTNLQVRFEGVAVSDVHPRSTPDVFQGEQLILYGRFRGAGKGKVVVSGVWDGAARELSFDVEFPDVTDDDRHSFVPRLWAGQRVDFLLREIRNQDKPEQELVDEVIRLAKRYGIVTPYTSFLMGEDLFHIKPPGFYRGRVLERAQIDVAPGTAPMLKREIVEGAKDQAANRRSNAAGNFDAYEAQIEKQLQAEGRKDASSLEALRSIGSRTFYKRGEYWLESEYDEAKHGELIDVEVGSPGYFELIDRDGRLAKFLALEQLIFNVEGRWYRIQRKRG